MGQTSQEEGGRCQCTPVYVVDNIQTPIGMNMNENWGQSPISEKHSIILNLINLIDSFLIPCYYFGAILRGKD